MAFPIDQINNREAFDKLIRDGLTFERDELLTIKNRTWLYKALRDKINVKIGSNPGTNTLLDGSTTLYKVIDEKSYASFREIRVNEETDNLYDIGDKRFQLEVPIKQGITKSQRTTFSEFMYDEQTGRQLRDEQMTPDVFLERISSFKVKMDEILAKWVDITLFDLLFNTDYITKEESNTDTHTDGIIPLSYAQLTNEISNISSYKFVYDIERILVLSETVDINDNDLLGIIPITDTILSFFKKQFLDDGGFNTMTALERNNYVSQYAVEKGYFIFPNSRIAFVTMPFHLKASLLNTKIGPTAFTIRFISREAIEQINHLPNICDDIQNYEHTMIRLGFGKTETLEANYYKGGELGQTYGFGVRSGSNKLISAFYWFAGIRMCLKPKQPKRSCCTFTLDNDAIFGGPVNVTAEINSAVNYQTSIILNRISNT